MHFDVPVSKKVSLGHIPHTALPLESLHEVLKSQPPLCVSHSIVEGRGVGSRVGEGAGEGVGGVGEGVGEGMGEGVVGGVMPWMQFSPLKILLVAGVPITELISTWCKAIACPAWQFEPAIRFKIKQ
jgi:hypothetical protein